MDYMDLNVRRPKKGCLITYSLLIVCEINGPKLFLGIQDMLRYVDGLVQDCSITISNGDTAVLH